MRRREVLAALGIGAASLLAPRPARAFAVRTIALPNCTADLYLPAGPWSKAMLVLHPGGFRTDIDISSRAAGFARNGYAALYVRYRLAPADPFPAAVQDTRDAAAWMRTHGAARLGAFGESAGGNLAYMVSDLLDAAVGFSGPTDLELSGPDLSYYIGCRYRDCPDRWDAASPFHVATAAWCPTYIGSSEFDQTVPLIQAQEYAARLGAMRVENNLAVVRGSSVHAALWRYLGSDVMAWLGRHL